MTTSIKIYMGNNIERQAAGVGIILIQFPIGQIIKVICVMHVLTLKKNLFFVYKTTNKRHNNMALCNNHCIIKSKLDENGKQIVFHCQQESNLYLVGVVVASSTNTFNATSSFFAITKTPTLQITIWHH